MFQSFWKLNQALFLPLKSSMTVLINSSRCEKNECKNRCSIPRAIFSSAHEIFRTFFFFEVVLHCKFLIFEYCYHFPHFSFSNSAIQPTKSTAEPKDKPAKTYRCQKEIPRNLSHDAFGWCQSSIATAIVWLLRLRGLRDSASDGDDVCGAEFHRKVSLIADEAERMALRGLQVLQRCAVSQLSSLLLCVANGELNLFLSNMLPFFIAQRNAKKNIKIMMRIFVSFITFE